MTLSSGTVLSVSINTTQCTLTRDCNTFNYSNPVRYRFNDQNNRHDTTPSPLISISLSGTPQTAARPLGRSGGQEFSLAARGARPWTRRSGPQVKCNFTASSSASSTRRPRTVCAQRAQLEHVFWGERRKCHFNGLNG